MEFVHLDTATRPWYHLDLAQEFCSVCPQPPPPHTRTAGTDNAGFDGRLIDLRLLPRLRS